MKKQFSFPRPTAYILFCLTGMLFLFCCLTENTLAEQGNIFWTSAYTIKILSISFFGGSILGAAICTFWGFLDFRRSFHFENAIADKDTSYISSRISVDITRISDRCSFLKTFMYSMILNILAWLPAYLAYYPAICAYDMPIQLGQITDGHYNDHHPLFHTFLLKLFMNIGKSIGSINAGIGLLSLLQVIFLAASFACGITFLYQHGIKKIWLAAAQLCCMLYPFHWYMSVSITKDTVFTGFFVLLLLSLYNLLLSTENKRHISKKECFFFLASIGTILFRNNGKYAYLVLLSVLFLLAAFKKEKRHYYGKIFLWALGAFLTGSLLLSAAFRLSHAEQGDRREMLSLPIQQLSRTYVNHGGVYILPEDDNTMAETDKALVNDFILDEGYKNYRPDISDPVKSHTNTYIVRYRFKDFLTTYLRLFTTYPADYMNAALAINAGYLYPGDITHAYINVIEGRTGRGYIQTCWDPSINSHNIHKAAKWNWLFTILEKWADENAYLKIPLLKYLFVPGVWLWFYLILLARFVMKKQYLFCIPLSLIIGYFITLFLGPAVQLRYIYPVMAAFPFILFLD